MDSKSYDPPRLAGYTGMIGERNLGDEAILSATRELFSEWKIIEDTYLKNANISIVGGGTVLPAAVSRDYYDLTNRKYNFCLGPGVLNPSFWKQPRAPVDLRILSAKYNIDLNSLWDRVPESGKYVIDSINETLGSPLEYSTFYPDKRKYKDVSEFDFDRIGVRGPISKNILNKYGIQSKIVGDPALALQPDEYHYDSSGSIALTLRNSQGSHPKWTNSDDYVSKIITFINEYLPNKKIICLPFNPSDIPLHVDVCEKLINAKMLDYTTQPDIQGIMNKISEVELMIGERLHANILAASCHTPFISLEYTPKSEDFVSSIQMEQMNHRIDELSVSKLEHSLQQITDQNVQKHLIKSVTSLREELKEFTDEIKDDVVEIG